MMENEKTITIDGYKQLIVYASPETSTNSRLSVTELLGTGGLHFHNAGISNQKEVKFTSLIAQTDPQLQYFENAHKIGKSVEVISTFAHIPTGEYFFTGKWNPKYLEGGKYFEVAWDLTLKGLNDVTTEFYDSDEVSTSQSLNSDSTSFNSNSTIYKEGCSDSNIVKQLQILLQYNGYYVEKDGVKLQIDGVWDNDLTEALQLFQSHNQLSVNGELNAETKDKLCW